MRDEVGFGADRRERLAIDLPRRRECSQASACAPGRRDRVGRLFDGQLCARRTVRSRWPVAR